VWLLYGIAVIMILSLLPIMRISDTYEGFPWGYRETFGSFSCARIRKLS